MQVLHQTVVVKRELRHTLRFPLWFRLRDRVKGSDIRRSIGVKLLRVKRSQLMWFGHLVGMLPGCLSLEGFCAGLSG